MKNEVLEAYYCKPLRFLKLRGRCFDAEPEKVEIFEVGGGNKLGDAILNVWMYQPPKEFAAGQKQWAFCKVTDDVPDMTVIRVWYADGAWEECRVPVEKIDHIPPQFVATKGTTDGITVNDREQESSYWRSQLALDLKPEMQLLYIEPSSACNLRCEYCMASADYNSIDRGVISGEVLDAALASVREMPDVRMLQLHAFGEPLTNRGFCKMLRRIRNETNVRQIGFFSNGMLLTREVSDELSHIPLQMRIVISIDGNTPQENDAQRQGADYSVIRENLLYFLGQIKHREKVVVQINNIHVAGEHEQIYVPEFLLNDFGYLQIDSHRPFYDPEMSEHLSDHNMQAHEKPDKKICKRVFKQTVIRSNGDVVPCCWFSGSKMVMGNILDRSLKDIWHGERYMELRKKMAPGVPLEELPEGCRNCYAMNDSYLYKG